MTTYNTRNPLGSSDPRDLFDNSQNTDHAANSLQALEWTDRFGNRRKTWHGIEHEAQVQIARAEAAAEASGDVRFASSYAQMAARLAAGRYADGNVVEVFADESKGGDRTRYLIESGQAVFKINLSFWKTYTDGEFGKLSGAGGARRVGHLAQGRSVEQVLSDIPNRADYGSDPAFEAARTGKPNIDAAGQFDAPVTPLGGKPQPLSTALQYSTNGPRCRIQWAGYFAVRVDCPAVVMGGFRFHGRHERPIGPAYSAPSRYATLNLKTDLMSGIAHTDNNWYGVFAIANKGDTQCGFTLMPFLKVKSVAAGVATLAVCGEDIAIASGGMTTATYGWANNALVGVEVLVITEGALGYFSGRKTTIKANTASTITLTANVDVGPKSLLLLAPKGFDYFSYLGSFYQDNEIRNISDSGTVVMGKMNDLSYYHANTGGRPTYLNGLIPLSGIKRLDCSGFISPLATAIILQGRASISTASTGDYAMYMSTDSSNHVVAAYYSKKTTASTETFQMPQATVPLPFGPNYWVYTAGSVAADAIYVANEIVGWIEP